MAGKTAEEWEAYDEARIALAFQEIAKSENLRFLFRSLLNSWGLDQTPYAGNALDTAHLCGRHAVATEFVSLIMANKPELYPALLKEDQDELSARS